jgi:uncharacterized membrane protein
MKDIPSINIESFVRSGMQDNVDIRTVFGALIAGAFCAWFSITLGLRNPEVLPFVVVCVALSSAGVLANIVIIAMDQDGLKYVSRFLSRSVHGVFITIMLLSFAVMLNYNMYQDNLFVLMALLAWPITFLFVLVLTLWRVKQGYYIDKKGFINYKGAFFAMAYSFPAACLGNLYRNLDKGVAPAIISSVTLIGALIALTQMTDFLKVYYIMRYGILAEDEAGAKRRN